MVWGWDMRGDREQISDLPKCLQHYHNSEQWIFAEQLHHTQPGCATAASLTLSPFPFPITVHSAAEHGVAWKKHCSSIKSEPSVDGKWRENVKLSSPKFLFLWNVKQLCYSVKVSQQPHKSRRHIRRRHSRGRRPLNKVSVSLPPIWRASNNFRCARWETRQISFSYRALPPLP